MPAKEHNNCLATDHNEMEINDRKVIRIILENFNEISENTKKFMQNAYNKNACI